MIIRQKFYKQIISTIDQHERFENSDFDIKTDENKIIKLTITYLAESKYQIIFNLPKSQTTQTGALGLPNSDYSFDGTVCPGPMALTETFQFRGEDGIFRRIKTWLDCIWEELSSNPVVKQLEEQQEQIDQIFEKFDNLPDEFFTKEEAADLKKRLDELEETLKENMQKQNADNAKFEEQIDELHIDIDTLKVTIHSLKKKGWIKSFFSKSLKWGMNSENRKLIKDGYSLVKALLPEDIKGQLPE
jgi:hypothetical protein